VPARLVSFYSHCNQPALALVGSDVQEYVDPTEMIDLRVFSSVKSSEDYTNRPHSFDVYSSEMVFSMVAESEAEKEGPYSTLSSRC